MRTRYFVSGLIAAALLSAPAVAQTTRQAPTRRRPPGPKHRSL